MAFQQPPAHAPELPRKLDVHLEALAAFQAGAATLQAGTALALREADGRLTAVTQDGTAVGLIPADKRLLLSRGPWAGAVRSVKRQPAAGPAAPALAAAASSQQQAADTAQLPEQQPEDRQQSQQQQAGDASGAEQQAAAVPPAEQSQGPSQPPAAVVVQVLVRFTPEEQRWAQRPAAGQLVQQAEEEDTARLSTEQFEALAANEELRWMLRDERLQKVVADIDAAPDRERALLRALQAPNFKEFADKVLNVVAPEAT